MPLNPKSNLENIPRKSQSPGPLGGDWRRNLSDLGFRGMKVSGFRVSGFQGWRVFRA